MLQKIRVSKRFTFDMAHALFGYDGPCKNIHGHTYHLCITLIGMPILDSDDPKQGMVADFGHIKKIVKKVVIDRFDHALVLNENAPYANLGSFFSEFEQVIPVPFQPTCENLLLHFVELLKDKFPSEIKLLSLRLDETPTSYSEWFLADNL